MRRTILIFSSAFFLIIFHTLGLLTPLENSLVKILKFPFFSLKRASITVHNFWTDVIEWKEVRRERDKLNEELNELKKIIVERNILISENEELKELLNYTKNTDQKIVVASIIGKDNDPTREILVLDKGKNSGIYVGAPVIVKEGILIGKIIRVEKNRSEIGLLTDPAIRVAVSVEGTKGTNGLAIGDKAVSLKVNFIPKDVTLKTGLLVYTSGLEERVPRGLLLGSILQIENRVEEPFSSIVVQRAIDPSSLNVAAVLL